MTVQGTASAAATTITIPSHQPGDMIWIFAFAASNTNVNPPLQSGTVPFWSEAEAAGANSVALTSAYAVASASNHTSGTWTGAADLCCLVLRPTFGRVLSVPSASTGNGANTQTIIYPALTMSTLAGSSWGLRCGCRGVAVAAVGTAPTGWTNQIIQPATPLMAVHTHSAVTANPTADTVTTTSSNSAYRGHTIEIAEPVPPADPIGMII